MRTVRVSVPLPTNQADFGYFVVQAASVRELEDKLAELMSEATQVERELGFSVWCQPCGSLVIDRVPGQCRFYQPMIHRHFYEDD